LPLKIAAGGFIAGQVLFIAPLYVKAISDKKTTFAKVMPIGGAGMMTGWASLIFA